MRLRGFRRSIAMGISAVLLAAACGGTAQPQPAASAAPATSTGAAAPTASRAPGVLHVYSINALTGASGPFGKRTNDAVVLRAKQITDAGGFTDSCGNKYTVKVTSEDMANSREQAVALQRKAAADPTVIGVIGPTSSVGYVAMVPVAGQLSIPIVGTGAGAAITEWNPFSYRINVVPAFATPIMIESLKKKFDIKKLAILYDIAQDALKTDAEIQRDLASKLGYQVVAFEAFRTGDPDVRAQLTKIKAAGPDWIAYNASGEEMARAINQAYELGLGDINKMSGFSQWDNPNVWDLTQGKAKGGYSWATAVDVSSADKKIVDYIAEYKKALNDDPTIYSLYGRDAMDLFVDAAKRSCTATDRTKFNTELRKTNGFTGIATKITFTNGHGENTTPLVKITRTVDRTRSEEVK